MPLWNCLACVCLSLPLLARGAWGGEEPKPLEPAPVPAPDQPLKPIEHPAGKWKVPPEEGAEVTPPAPAPRPGSWQVAGEEDPKPGSEAPGEAAPSAERPASPLLAEAIAKEEQARARKQKLKSKELAELYGKVVAAEPENAEAHYRLGVALSRGGDAKGGLAELERALILGPEKPAYLCDYGSVALQLGILDKARAACVKAVQAAPNSARYRNALGNVLLAAGQNQGAADSYLQAVALDPNNARLIHNLARALLAGRNAKEAVEKLDEVIRLDPKAADAYNDRALAHLALKKEKEAIADLEEAVKLNPDYAQAHHNLAQLYANENDPFIANRFQALDHAQAAVKLSGGRNPSYMMGLAEAWLANRRYENAITAAKVAITLDPTDKSFQEKLEKFETLKKQGYLERPTNVPVKE